MKDFDFSSCATICDFARSKWTSALNSCSALIERLRGEKLNYKMVAMDDF